MRDTVFVTGASGMLGANLCRRLVQEGIPVRALVRRPLEHPLLQGLPLRQVIGSLADVPVLREAMTGCRAVFHVAGVISYHDKDREHLYETNLAGTRNVLRAAALAGVPRVVYTSSTAAVGIPDDEAKPLHEGDAFHPRYRSVHYMASKRAAEDEALSRADVEVVAVNPGTIYGAGDINMNTGMLFRQIKRRTPRWVPPGGTAVVSVRDCVEGHLLALQCGKSGHRYILVSGNYSYLKLWSAIARALGLPPPLRTLSSSLYPLAYGAGYVHDKMLPRQFRSPIFSRHLVSIAFRRRYFDSSRARKELGWVPTQSLDEMLAEAAAFYEKHGLL